MPASPVTAVEASDSEVAARVAVLELPDGDRRRDWIDFIALLDSPRLNTDLLAEWLGRDHVDVDVQSRLAANGARQDRTTIISITVDELVVPLCHATASVDLAALPEWCRDPLSRPEVPLGRTLRRVGFVRTREVPALSHPLPADLDAVALTVSGWFYGHNGGPPVASMIESYTGHVGVLRGTSSTQAGAAVTAPAWPAPDQLGSAAEIDLRDSELVALLEQRLLRAGQDPVADHLLRAALMHQLGAGQPQAPAGVAAGHGTGAGPGPRGATTSRPIPRLTTSRPSTVPGGRS